jgi:uncharacterized protein (TIGR03083 family)
VPTSLAFDQHLDALQASGGALLCAAVAAGFDAQVPTCPTWTARALVSHQAMVHRWAAANVRGEDPDAVPSQTTIRTTVDDLPDYYEAGLGALVAALRDAPEDLVAPTFLNDAPPPRRFWARRQAHETTIHMVDARAAELGRWPATCDLSIEPALAVDGIDELLFGFFSRGRSKLYDGIEYDVAVVAGDVGQCWLLHVGEKLRVTNESTKLSGAAAVISGSASAVYLALWNRGDDVELDGDAEVLDRWRATQRVRWS